ncbi:MAG: hypothetical protein AAF547_16750 [Actinomycetota bacterium]
MATRIDRLRGLARATAWWTVPQLVVAVGVGIVLGALPFLLGYAVANSLGLWAYLDRLPLDRQRRRRWLQALAIGLIPVGFGAVLAIGSVRSPSEASSSGSEDPSIRRATAGTLNKWNQPGTP